VTIEYAAHIAEKALRNVDGFLNARGSYYTDHN